MLVVHAWWSPVPAPTGALGLWAEDSTAPAAPKRRLNRLQRHPFAASVADLAAALGVPAGAGRAEVSLELPGEGRGPQASPELVRSGPARGGTQPPAAWSVPAALVDPGEALRLLLAPPAGEDLALGSGWRQLTALALAAVDLTGRGRLLPGVAGAPPGPPRAVWLPVLTGADAAWLRALAATVPPAMLAERSADGEPATSAGRQVAMATDALVDAAARRAAGPSAAGRGPVSRPATAWRRALAAADPQFRADEAQAAGLRRALESWQRDAAAGAVRACFRLVEPGEDDDEAQPPAWQVQFALQSADEPSLVVEAERVWRSRSGTGVLSRLVTSPQETMLAELGRAARIWPQIDDALRTARPAGLPLGAEGAHTFLSAAAPMLDAAGFGVLLPGWWSKPASRLGLRLRASTPAQPAATDSGTGIGREALVGFSWELAVGEHTLTEQEIADLVAERAPLVKLRGQWVPLDRARLARGLSLLRDGGRSGAMSLAEVLGAIGSPDDGPEGLPVVQVDADGWLADLLADHREQRLEPVKLPGSFSGTLRPYQERGLAWLSFLERIGVGGVLADDMGLGKTVQLLALMSGDAPDGGPTLLVCPMSLVGNWRREAARFAPELRVHVHHGAERARGPEFAAAVTGSDLVLTTYALVARDVEALRAVGWRRVVLDEAQAVKNAATRAAVAVRSLPARRRFAVTGTPVENRLADLWSLMEFANPGLLGTAAEFKQRYAVPVERHGDDGARLALRSLTRPFVLRREKTDRTIITDLPEKLEMDVVCSLTSEQAALYQAVVQDMMEKISSSEGIERRGLVLATMSKLKQVCNHPAQFLGDGSRLGGRSGKLARLEETLDEVLAGGERALLFTQFAGFGALLQPYLTARFGREVLFLHGRVPQPERDAMVARFQGGEGPAMFILSLKAGGTGLTLTAANHVVHVDRWWNPAVEDQATDRAFRIGQRRAVQVRKLVCAGTLEERIADLITGKRGLAASIVGSGEGWLTELSTAQLRDLFTLRAGAVVE